MSQSEPKKFDRIAILTNPSLKEVYDKLTDLAKEFAVLGEIETTKALISLLLQDTTSDWQRRQISASANDQLAVSVCEYIAGDDKNRLRSKLKSSRVKVR